MGTKIEMGSILIEEGTLLPDALRFESAPYSNGWRLITNVDGGGLDRKVREAGWTFFYMADEIKASVLGFDGEEALRKALNKVIAHMKSDRLNCLEIAQVTVKRFLGLPYVTVSAHPRHVQEGMFLCRAKRLAEWDQAQFDAA